MGIVPNTLDNRVKIHHIHAQFASEQNITMTTTLGNSPKFRYAKKGGNG